MKCAGAVRLTARGEQLLAWMAVAVLVAAMAVAGALEPGVAW